VEQVRAEFSLAHGFLQVLVRGGEETNVDFNGPRAANADKLAFLQDAKQLGLQRER